MKTESIRQAFLKYFSDNGHTIVTSSSLVPGSDPTLLFTNAGMVQFKDCFLGSDVRPYVRATTCQKCLRISGKHNDLENVGRTARHHTFFEMLGNFSFGDYFKEQAIKFGWQFLTEVLALPKDRLWVTVYEEDQEAEDLWRDLTDVLPGRIVKMGKDDNFWAMGETGPCGPCSEIHYFLGSDTSVQSEADFLLGDGRYIEIWNLVFMQFNRDTTGALTPLPKPSVDTGMGLERVAAVKQGVVSNYDTDLLRELITIGEKLSGKRYVGKSYQPKTKAEDPQYDIDVALRVLADHTRAASFLIADGVNPASDGRGYVLRRVIRRACRHGRVLGLTEPFLFKIADRLVELMAETYPELGSSRDKILKVIRAEEEKFLTTLDSGLSVLTKEVRAVKERGAKKLAGEIAFLLHDTYGFPLDLTQDIVKADTLEVDEAGFQSAMETQRERSRSARANSSDLILQRAVKPSRTEFVGYDFDEYESEVTGLFSSAGDISSAEAGDEIVVIAAQTPFYAESGGQVGDTGSISAANGVLEVIDTQKVGGETIAHICRVAEGSIRPGEKIRLMIETGRRARLRANHSATHLVHQALREVIGDHVKQAGSRVSSDALRFDYTHFEAPTDEQLHEIETRVNAEIRSNHPVVTDLLPLEEARKSGAMALFGEKYGSTVRVVQIGPRSRELCGGTHVRRSGDIGFFGFDSESGISSGVRRIEGFAGVGAIQNWRLSQERLREIASLLKVSERDVPERVRKLLDLVKQLERNLERSQNSAQKAAGDDLGKLAKVTPSGVTVVTSVIAEASPKQLRELADDLKVRLRSGALALGSVHEGKAIVLAAVTPDLVERYHAGSMVEQLNEVLGGRGGGRADMAQAGGGDPTKLSAALERFESLFGSPPAAE